MNKKSIADYKKRTSAKITPVKPNGYIHIKHRFTFLNEYIDAERSSKYEGAKIKKAETTHVSTYFNSIKIPTPIKLHFTWYVKHYRYDLDNLGFAAKFVLDGMVKAGAIENDNLKYIKKITHDYKKTDEWGVIVEWEEWE